MSKTQHSHRDHSPGCHVTASVALRDDTLASDDGCSGLAVKQLASGIDTPRADLDLIALGEKYYILDSGEADVEIPAGLGFAPVKGTRLWINPATNALANAAGAGLEKLGVVRYIAPERGLSAGLMTVSFDARKDF
jgi:hypothetical protein